MSGTHARILDALEHAAAGMTDADLELVLKIPPNTLRPRRRELVTQGKVRDSGLNRNGAIVWEINPTGEKPAKAPDARKAAFNRLRSAAEPFRARAEVVAGGCDGLPDKMVVQVPVRIELGALREFIAAAEA